VLVSGAAGLVRSLWNLRRLEPGFSKDHLLLLSIDPMTAGYKGARTAILNRRLLEYVRAIPGVTSASMSSLPLMEGKSHHCCIQVPGYTPSRSERMVIRTLNVVPEYFSTLGMALVAGRESTDRDGRSEPKSVAVNEKFVSRYFNRGIAAIGKTFQFDSRHCSRDSFRLFVPRKWNQRLRSGTSRKPSKLILIAKLSAPEAADAVPVCAAPRVDQL
jgi:hypothetical protein